MIDHVCHQHDLPRPALDIDEVEPALCQLDASLFDIGNIFGVQPAGTTPDAHVVAGHPRMYSLGAHHNVSDPADQRPVLCADGTSHQARDGHQRLGQSLRQDRGAPPPQAGAHRHHRNHHGISPQ